jgi:hypothetical protein
MPRYTNRRKILNDPSSGGTESIYQEIIDKRNIKQVTQYESPVFPELTVARRRAVQYDSHVWKRGDRLYKLAYNYYGNSSLWYLIAWFNQTPTESHINIGDTIMVPISAESVMVYFNNG